MACPACTIESARGATFCGDCGSRLQAAKPPASQGKLPVTKRKFRVLFVGSVFLCALAAGAWALHPSPIETLLPDDVAGFVTVDASWWWRESALVRHQPRAAAVIAEAERQTNVSVEDDIAPWVGKISVAALQTDPERPQIVVIAQVRNWFAFARCISRLKTKTAQKTGAAWTTDKYNNTNVQRLNIHSRYRSNLPIETAMIKNWVVIAIGDGVMEKVVNASEGKIPSLQTNTTWMKALAALPQDAVLLGAADSDALGTNGIGLSATWRSQPYSQNIDACALSDEGNGLRMEAVNCPKTHEGRDFWRDFKGTNEPVSDKFLSRLPDETSIAVLINNPNQWWTQSRYLFEGSMDTWRRNDWDQSLGRLGSVVSDLDHFTQGCGTAFLWRSDRGFGAVAVAQADSTDNSEHMSNSLAELLGRQGEPMRQDGSLWRPESLTYSGGDPLRSLRFAPCWKAQEEQLVLATDPNWIDLPAGNPSLQFPDDAQNADIIALGNFHVLPTILDQYELHAYSPTDKQSFESIRNLNLKDAHWAAWVTLDPGGEWQKMTVSIQDWDWRQALDASAHLLTEVH